MKKWFMVAFGALIITLSMSACNTGALVFNNKMIEVQQSIEPQLLAFSNKMAVMGEDANFKALAGDAKLMIVALDNGISKIKALEAPKNGEEFKRSMLAWLAYMKKFSQQTLQLGEESTTQAEKLQIALDFQKAEAAITRLEEDTQAKQREFANANGFDLK